MSRMNFHFAKDFHPIAGWTTVKIKIVDEQKLTHFLEECQKNVLVRTDKFGYHIFYEFFEYIRIDKFTAAFVTNMPVTIQELCKIQTCWERQHELTSKDHGKYGRLLVGGVFVEGEIFEPLSIVDVTHFDNTDWHPLERLVKIVQGKYVKISSPVAFCKNRNEEKVSGGEIILTIGV